jgi:hypothetical protein
MDFRRPLRSFAERAYIICCMNQAAVIFNILTIFAIISGPIIALQLQRFLESRRELRQRKLWIFRAIMSNRATILNQSYVQALNLIDIDFSSNSKHDKAVRTAWKILLDHLSTKPGKDKAAVNASNERAVDLRVALMKSLAQALGYDFDEVQIKKGSYLPTGHSDMENEQTLLRKRTLEVLNGTRRLPVGVFQETFPVLGVRPEDD